MPNHRHPRTSEKGARKIVKGRRKRKSPLEADAITTSRIAGGIALGDIIEDVLGLDLVVEAEVEVEVEVEATIATIGSTLVATILSVMTAIIGAVIGIVIDMMTEVGIVVTRDIDGTMMTIETIGQRGAVTEGTNIRPRTANGGKRIPTKPNQKWNTTTDPKN